jgi:hypothetical protein
MKKLLNGCNYFMQKIYYSTFSGSFLSLLLQKKVKEIKYPTLYTIY